MRTFFTPLAAALGAVAFAFAGTAHATVDDILDYAIVYEQPQTGDLCYRTLPMWAEIGIPGASVMKGVFAPVQIFNQNGRPAPYVNINLAAPSTPMVASYVSDAIDANGVMSYAMKVDVTALANANGATLWGRTQTIQSAKIGLLAMARSLSGISGGRYRLRVQFVGLPSQQGVPGTPLYATTSSPYSAGSALLAAYEHELVNVNGTCR